MIAGAPVWLQVVLALVGTAGLGGVLARLWDRWLGHRATARKQTDDMALHSNAAWEARVLKVEADCAALRAEIKAEREACDRQLSEMRHALANEVMSWEALATAIRFNPGEALAVLEHVEGVRKRRMEEARTERRLRLAEARAAERGALREMGQAAASAVHVTEAIAVAAAG